MTEREYINVQEKTKLDSILQLISEVCPENSEVISTSEFQEISSKLWNWRDKLREKYKVD